MYIFFKDFDFYNWLYKFFLIFYRFRKKVFVDYKLIKWKVVSLYFFLVNIIVERDVYDMYN